MILVDTGPLVATLAATDANHARCVRFFDSDLLRMAELVEIYADFPLGATDASVVAVAERLGLTEIATLDRRHFSVVRPLHTSAFHLLPD